MILSSVSLSRLALSLPLLTYSGRWVVFRVGVGVVGLVFFSALGI